MFAIPVVAVLLTRVGEDAAVDEMGSRVRGTVRGAIVRVQAAMQSNQESIFSTCSSTQLEGPHSPLAIFSTLCSGKRHGTT